MCSPVCCCILSKRQSQSMASSTVMPGTAVSGREGTLCQRMPSCSWTSVTASSVPSGRVRVAPVGRLTAAFRVEHRTFQREESAAGTAVRHGGQQDAFGPGAEGIRFKIFFSALHGA